MHTGLRAKRRLDLLNAKLAHLWAKRGEATGGDGEEDGEEDGEAAGSGGKDGEEPRHEEGGGGASSAATAAPADHQPHEPSTARWFGLSACRPWHLPEVCELKQLCCWCRDKEARLSTLLTRHLTGHCIVFVQTAEQVETLGARLCLPRAAAAGADPLHRAEPPVVGMEPRVRRHRRRRRDVLEEVEEFDAFGAEELALLHGGMSDDARLQSLHAFLRGVEARPEAQMSTAQDDEGHDEASEAPRILITTDALFEAAEASSDWADMDGQYWAIYGNNLRHLAAWYPEEYSIGERPPRKNAKVDIVQFDPPTFACSGEYDAETYMRRLLCMRGGGDGWRRLVLCLADSEAELTLLTRIQTHLGYAGRLQMVPHSDDPDRYEDVLENWLDDFNLW